MMARHGGERERLALESCGSGDNPKCGEECKADKVEDGALKMIDVN